MDDESKRRTAYHEAGHFLATHRLNEAIFSGQRVLEGLSIVPRGDSLGREEGELFVGDAAGLVEATEAEVEAVVIELYAGRVAEARCDPNLPPEQLKAGARSDDEKAAELLARLPGDPRENEARLRKRADYLVWSEWSGVEALAAELLEYMRLDADEAEAIVDIARGRDGVKILERLRQI